MANEKPGFMGGLVVGAIFGVIGAVFLSSKRGAELKDELKTDAGKVGHRADDIKTSAVDTATVAASEIKTHGSELLESVKAHGAELKNEAAQHLEVAKANVGAKVDELTGKVRDAKNDVAAKTGEVAESVSAKAEEIKDKASDLKDKAGEIKDKAAEVAGEAKLQAHLGAMEIKDPSQPVEEV